LGFVWAFYICSLTAFQKGNRFFGQLSIYKVF